MPGGFSRLLANFLDFALYLFALGFQLGEVIADDFGLVSLGHKGDEIGKLPVN
ncbi:MAG: hypothetical protein M5U25_20720 [Planctomycetota bacterium]|nr:hypothetical protein [Planctomycetota bacterium]